MDLDNGDSTDSSMTPCTSTSEKMRKRKKFIRKVPCQVCGDVANDHIHYGAKCCYSCRAFFRRSVSAGKIHFMYYMPIHSNLQVYKTGFRTLIKPCKI